MASNGKNKESVKKLSLIAVLTSVAPYTNVLFTIADAPVVCVLVSLLEMVALLVSVVVP